MTTPRARAIGHMDAPSAVRTDRPRRRNVLPDDAWMARAACKEANAELFFPPEREPADKREVREATARAWCARCPVFAACAAYRQESNLQGLWAGRSDYDRAALTDTRRTASRAGRDRVAA